MVSVVGINFHPFPSGLKIKDIVALSLSMLFAYKGRAFFISTCMLLVADGFPRELFLRFYVFLPFRWKLILHVPFLAKKRHMALIEKLQTKILTNNAAVAKQPTALITKMKELIEDINGLIGVNDIVITKMMNLIKT